ncbi:MAG: tyrosine-type recombinase/integrase [Brachymonas sp.]|nr:tyrosine-type recombinase/integrase [Brachymonas sp.]
MKPFLFARGPKHYVRFYVPERCRKVFKERRYLTFALGEGKDHEIRLRACIVENHLHSFLKGGSMEIDLKNIRTFTIDLREGRFEAKPGDDHRAMMEALSSPVVKRAQLALEEQGRLAASSPKAPLPQPAQTSRETLSQLNARFLKLKKRALATQQDYRSTVQAFEAFFCKRNNCKTCLVTQVTAADVREFRNELSEKGNEARTLDKKIGTLKALYNFAIEEQSYIGNNPAKIGNLLTKKEKAAGGFLIFEVDEIKQIFTSDYFKEQKQSDPNYYWGCLLALLTATRHDEVVQLTKEQIKQTEKGTYYLQIRASKTDAGLRNIPFPTELIKAGFDDFIKDKLPHEKVFKYKRSGDALGKKFIRQVREIHKLDRGKLVFHSLRKFLNDQMLKSDVSIEARYQFMGHSLDNVNVQTYAQKLDEDHLFERTKNVSDRVLKWVALT